MAPHTKEAAGSTRFEAGHNRASLREGKQGVGGWSGDHTNRTNSQRKTAAASALSKPARGNKGGSLIQRTRSEEGERKWWRTAGNSFPQHRKPSEKPGTARPRKNPMQLSRDKSTQNYSELKPGEGDRKLEEGQQPGTPGCFCGLGLIYTNKSCTMPPITFQDLPLNIYMVIFGTGIFIFVLSLIFCCYFMSKLRHQAQSERFGYKEVVLKGDARKLNVHGQTCAVCLEDFKVKDDLGLLSCQHAFHRKCLVKWLEVRCVCPMCNKPIAGPRESHQSIGILLDELV
nr:RING finger protein 122 isoform X1 [Pogona vitticeps]